MSLKYELLPPDPKRVIEGLRDTGYQFNTAVADVVDNSIAAEAKKIDLFLSQDFKGNITLRIYDDGIGMDRGGLLNAMRYGSKARPSKASLGKFGLGLKTASTAFGRKLTVISRDKPGADLNMAVWDLDAIEDEWKVLTGEAGTHETKLFEEQLKGKRGTLVIWDKIDRLIRKYAVAGGAAARKALEAVAEDPKRGLRQHIAMVYQRFLDENDKRARTIKINLNGSPIDAWDPFCEGVSRMVGNEPVDVSIPGGGNASFRIRAFILPRGEQFPTPAQAKAARLSNDLQGIYVYRQERLIHGPDWLKLFVREPHLTLLRVEFSFDHHLDEYFQIDIKKSQIILEETIASFLMDFLGPRRREANEVYRKGTREEITRKTEGAHDVSNRNIAGKENQITQPSVKSFDVAAGTATIVNRTGEVKIHLTINPSTKKEDVYIQPVDSIDDGLLWEPTLVGVHCAVRINRGHPYYSKVYVPNLKEGVTIQGMDALLWALSVAELNCSNAETEAMFSDLRYDVSRNLKKLVEDLPEPQLNGDEPGAD
jgi:Histidine kinase-, DNA gyrase B-, and HSP90-like ATPase